MCGIAGALALDGNGVPGDRERIAAALRTLVHRGPDEEGLLARGPVVLGTRRLKVIDLAGGQQPVSNEDGTVWVSFNGEIFNHRELRARLEAAGHTFRSRCDTEVLVHLYEEHGDQLSAHLNGQFAFALWDERRKRLLLVRDRLGIRPLFYTRTPDGRILWASEIKALLAAGVPAKLDPIGLQHVFVFGAPSAPVTMFEGVKQLVAGHQLVVHEGRLEESTWWDLEMPAADSPPPDRGLDAHAQELRAMLEDAVRLQLAADVPVGVYLSGGLDSSVIAALTRREAGEQFRTFSIGFDLDFFDESSHARRVAEHLQAHQSVLHCRVPAMVAALPEAVHFTEHPSLVTEMIPLMMLSKLARKEVTVVLSGEGADEAFGGYHYFRVDKARSWFSRGPLSLLGPGLRWALRAMWGADFVLPDSREVARVSERYGFYPGMHFEFEMGRRLLERIASPDLARTLSAHDPVADLDLPRDRLARMTPFDQTTYLAYRLRLANHQISPLGDRVTMASSVEGRYPFLDHRLVELAVRMPERHKLDGFREKRVLRAAFADMLPKAIVERSKQPFQAPLGSAILETGSSYVTEMLSAETTRAKGYFDPVAVTAMVERLRWYSTHQPNRIDHDRLQAELALVGILTTHVFDEIYLQGRAWTDLA